MSTKQRQLDHDKLRKDTRTEPAEEKSSMVWRRYNKEKFAVPLLTLDGPNWRRRKGENVKIFVNVFRKIGSDCGEDEKLCTLVGFLKVGIWGPVHLRPAEHMHGPIDTNTEDIVTSRTSRDSLTSNDQYAASSSSPPLSPRSPILLSMSKSSWSKALMDGTGRSSAASGTGRASAASGNGRATTASTANGDGYQSEDDEAAFDSMMVERPSWDQEQLLSTNAPATQTKKAEAFRAGSVDRVPTQTSNQHVKYPVLTIEVRPMSSRPFSLERARPRDDTESLDIYRDGQVVEPRPSTLSNAKKSLHSTIQRVSKRNSTTGRSSFSRGTQSAPMTQVASRDSGTSTISKEWQSAANLGKGSSKDSGMSSEDTTAFRIDSVRKAERKRRQTGVFASSVRETLHTLAHPLPMAPSSSTNTSGTSRSRASVTSKRMTKFWQKDKPDPEESVACNDWVPKHWRADVWLDLWPVAGDDLGDKYQVVPLMEVEFRRDCVLFFNTIFPLVHGEMFAMLRDFAFDPNSKMRFKALMRRHMSRSSTNLDQAQITTLSTTSNLSATVTASAGVTDRGWSFTNNVGVRKNTKKDEKPILVEQKPLLVDCSPTSTVSLDINVSPYTEGLPLFNKSQR